MSEKSATACAHIKTYGKVQNVGFRFFVHRKAAAAGLVGWVGNSNGNAVEIMVEGDRKKIKQFTEDCRRGPAFSKVDRVEVEWQEPTGKPTCFEVR